MDWDIANAEEVGNWRVKQALEGEVVQAIVANAIRKGLGHLIHKATPNFSVQASELAWVGGTGQQIIVSVSVAAVLRE